MNSFERLRTPSGVMLVVIAMYAVKVVFKLALGFWLDVPAVYGDGLHNVVDIFEATTVIVVLWLASRNDEQYPNGRGNFESLAVFVEGGFLILVAMNVAWESGLGLLAYYRGLSQEVEGYHAYVWIAVLYALSAVLSILVSRLQISVGRAHNRPLVIADGKETLSDAYVELGVLAGAIGMVVDQNILWGHLAGLAVAYKLVDTGLELVRHGLQALLQRTIGLEHEQHIRQLFMETPGVRGVEQCRTWRVGGVVKVVIKVLLDARVDEVATRDLKWAVGARVAEYLTEHDLPESELFIRFDAGEPSDVRHAYLVRYEGDMPLVATGADATHLWVCDLQYGRITRIVEESLEEVGLQTLLVLKCARAVYGWLAEEETPLPCDYRSAILPVPPKRVG